MDIPIHADVYCEGIVSGRTTCLIINPVDEQVTHVVVADKAFPNIERLVPVELIVNSTQDSIHLRCSQSDLLSMEPFKKTDFIDSDHLDRAIPFEVPYLVWPYSMYETMPMPLEHDNIPAGEVAIHRYTSVRATDGEVGRVDEFVINPKNDSITHLVLREGHLWGQKEVTIPVSEIKEITEEVVFLKLDKKAISLLPAIPIQRRWK